MSERDESGMRGDDVAKTLEVARLHFRVETPMTVATDAAGIERFRFAGPEPTAGDIPVPVVAVPLADALDGLLSDTVGDGFGIVQVRVRPAGSIEIVAIVVAGYLAVTQAVTVVENLEKVVRLGRRLVVAVLRARGMPVAAVHGRVALLPAMDRGLSGRGRTGDDRSSVTGRRAANLIGPMTSLLVLSGLNLLLVIVVIAILLAR